MLGKPYHEKLWIMVLKDLCFQCSFNASSDKILTVEKDESNEKTTSMRISETPSLISNSECMKYWPQIGESVTKFNVDKKRSKFVPMKKKKSTNTKSFIILKVR